MKYLLPLLLSSLTVVGQITPNRVKDLPNEATTSDLGEFLLLDSDDYGVRKITVGNITSQFTAIRNVEAYGADGSNTNDDTASIANTISSAPAGAAVYIPEGGFVVSSTINIPSSITLIGPGILYVTNNPNPLFSVTGDDVCIEGLTIVGSDTTSDWVTNIQTIKESAAVRLNGAADAKVVGNKITGFFTGIYATNSTRVRIENNGLEGVSGISGYTNVAESAGVILDGIASGTVVKNDIRYFGTGVREDGIVDVGILANDVSGNLIRNTYGDGIYVETTSQSLYNENRFSSVEDDAIEVYGTENIISKNRIYNSGGSGIVVGPYSTSANTNTVDNVFTWSNVAFRGQVSTVSITAAGTGYTNELVTVTGGSGTGARFHISVDGGGGITGVTTIDPGYGYTSSDVLTVVGSGSSGTITVDTVGDLDVNGHGTIVSENIINITDEDGIEVVANGTISPRDFDISRNHLIDTGTDGGSEFSISVLGYGHKINDNTFVGHNGDGLIFCDTDLSVGASTANYLIQNNNFRQGGTWTFGGFDIKGEIFAQALIQGNFGSTTTNFWQPTLAADGVKIEGNIMWSPHFDAYDHNDIFISGNTLVGIAYGSGTVAYDDVFITDNNITGTLPSTPTGVVLSNNSGDTSKDKLGVGTDAPSQDLDVDGSIVRIRNSYAMAGGEGAGSYSWTTNGVFFDIDGSNVRQLNFDGTVNVFDVRVYGATGDGATDDSAHIQDAINAAEAVNGTVYFPPGNYFIEAELEFLDCHVTSEHGAIITWNGSTAPTGAAVTCGTTGSATFNNRYHLPEIINGDKVGNGNWLDVSGYVGLRLLNLNTCTVSTRNVKSFETGVKVDGQGFGCVYNDFHLKWVQDNKISVHLTGDATGFVNENNFWGGKWNIQSTYNKHTLANATFSGSTLTEASALFATGGISSGDSIIIDGTTNNNGIYTVTTPITETSITITTTFPSNDSGETGTLYRQEGVYNVLIDDLSNFVNGNKFWGVDLESFQAEYAIQCSGGKNYFNNCRYEHASDGERILFTGSNADYNIVSYGGHAVDITLTESSGAGGNKLYADQRINPDTGYFNVKDFGAVGDNTGDQSTAIQAAIDAAAATTPVGIVYIPAGRYQIQSALELKNNIQIVGAGPRNTQLRFDGTGLNGFDNTSGTRLYNVRLDSLGIYSQSGDHNAIAINFHHVSDSLISNCFITGGSSGSAGTDGWDIGIAMHSDTSPGGCFRNTVENTYVYTYGNAASIGIHGYTDSADNYGPNSLKIDRCYIISRYGTGLKIDDGNNIVIRDSAIEGGTATGVHFNDDDGHNVISGVRFENTADAATNLAFIFDSNSLYCTATENVMASGLADPPYTDSGSFNSVYDLYNDATSLNKPQAIVGRMATMQEPVFNVKAYGALGNAIVDDTTAIQAAANAASNYIAGSSVWQFITPTLYFPPGRYDTTDTIVVSTNIDVIMDGTISFRGEADEAAIDIYAGDNGPHAGKYKINAYGELNHDWTNYNHVGVIFRSVDNADIQLDQVERFTVGAMFIGDGNGVAYNNIKVGRLGNAAIGLLGMGTNSGWFNENEIYGGRFFVNSSYKTSQESIGVKLISDYSFGFNAANDNIFYSPSFELNGDDASVDRIPIYIDNGQNNRFYDIRSEDNETAAGLAIAGVMTNYANNNVIELGVEETVTIGGLNRTRSRLQDDSDQDDDSPNIIISQFNEEKQNRPQRQVVIHDDFLVGGVGIAFGSMYTTNGATSQTLDTIGAFEDLVSHFDTAGAYANMDVDPANAAFTVHIPGEYHLDSALSFSGSSGALLEVAAFINGSIEPSVWVQRKLGTGGDVGSASLGGILTLAANDVVTIGATSNGAADTIQVDVGNVSMSYIDASNSRWHITTEGTGAKVTHSGGTTNAPGIIILNTGTTATGKAAFQSTLDASTSGGFFLAEDLYGVLSFRVNVPVLSTAGEEFELRVGLGDDNDFTAGNDMVAFEYDRASWGDFWRRNIFAGGVGNGAGASTEAVDAATWVDLRIVFHTNGNRIRFFVDDGQISSATTTLPDATKMRIVVQLEKTAGTTARTVEIDYINWTYVFKGERTYY